MPLPRHIAFVTIGATPRTDIVPEMVEEILAGRPAETLRVTEAGVLDGLEGDALSAILARDGEPAFATRDAKGREVAVSIERTEARLVALLQELDGRGFDLIVVLCTGTQIPKLANTVVIEAQKVVDHAIEALSIGDGPLGIVLPLPRQIEDFQTRHAFAVPTVHVAASPYDGLALAPRAKGLADCKLTVMHCMGYSRAMRDDLRAAVDHPVLTARGFVAACVGQFL